MASQTEKPTYAKMINAALTELKTRQGVTKQALEKHILTAYPDAKTMHIKNALKKAVETEAVAQVKGTGYKRVKILKKKQKFFVSIFCDF